MYKGEKVILTSYEPADAERARDLFNDLEMRRLLAPQPPLPLTIEEEEQFFADSRKNPEQRFNFKITTLDGKYIGGCSYFSTDRKSNHTYVGISIADKDYWGKGYGTDALRVLLDFLFLEMNFRKVMLTVMSHNPRALACYKKVGFKEEGRFKETTYRDGRYLDDIYMGIFKRDYLAG